MSDVLVSGVMALDHIIIQGREKKELLGGSAAFASIAASFHTRKAHLHGVVGDDFPSRYREVFSRFGVLLDGLETKHGGGTFRWCGKYGEDTNNRETVSRELNVLGEWDMEVPGSLRRCPVIILASATSRTHLQVLDQCESPRLVLADTMDHWIVHEREETDAVVSRSDIFVLNESEAHLYSGTRDLERAGEFLLSLGARFVIIKQGGEGSHLYTRDGAGTLLSFHCPAWPLEEVVDPTGAGDSFLGAMGGYLSRLGEDGLTYEEVKMGMAWGSVAASFVCEDFSTKRWERMTREEYLDRFALFRQLTSW